MNSMKTWFKKLLDQRKAARDRTPPLAAYFWDGGRPVAHIVKDISPTGFFLATEERWLLGTLVMITLQRTRTESSRPDSSLIVMSKVVHHGEDGVGFSFIPVEASSSDQRSQPGSHAADRRTLDRFLRSLASDHA
ncbi:MAG: PilZ domain-containing protein [Acidobacteriaceae bacterium]